jgi:hypothetical protein
MRDPLIPWGWGGAGTPPSVLLAEARARQFSTPPPSPRPAPTLAPLPSTAALDDEVVRLRAATGRRHRQGAAPLAGVLHPAIIGQQMVRQTGDVVTDRLRARRFGRGPALLRHRD